MYDSVAARTYLASSSARMMKGTGDGEESDGDGGAAEADTEEEARLLARVMFALRERECKKVKVL